MMSRIIPPRVALVDPQTGLIDRSWFLYFLALTSEVETLQANPFDISPLAPALADTAGALQDAIGPAPLFYDPGLAARVDALERLVDDLRKGTTVL